MVTVSQLCKSKNTSFVCGLTLLLSLICILLPLKFLYFFDNPLNNVILGSIFNNT